MSKRWNVPIIAATAIALVVIVLWFITINPWLLLGIPAVLWAIAAIIRAIAAHAPEETDADTKSSDAS